MLSDEVYCLGVHLGTSVSSCAVTPIAASSSQSPDLAATGTFFHCFDNHASTQGIASSGRFLPTKVECQATAGESILIQCDASNTLADILPTLIEMTVLPSSPQGGRDAEGGRHFLNDLFWNGEDGTPPTIRLERATMDAAVFISFLLKSVCEGLTTRKLRTQQKHSRFQVGALSSSFGGVHLRHIVFSIPSAMYYAAASGRLTCLAGAIDAAIAYLERHCGARCDGYSMMPSTAATLAAAVALDPSLLSSSDGWNEDNKHDPLTRSTAAKYIMECHIGGASASCAFVRVNESGRSELMSFNANMSGSGGDAIDLAILHHLLSAHQHVFVDSPLSPSGKLLCLRHIQSAKHQCALTREAQAVEIALPGIDYPLCFNLTVEMIENAATDLLFRKLTKLLQEAAVCAEQSQLFDKSLSSDSTTKSSSSILPSMRPSVVITSGGTLSVVSLRKRVESLARSLNGLSAKGTDGSKGQQQQSIRFYHAADDPTGCSSAPAGASYVAKALSQGSQTTRGASESHRQIYELARGFLFRPTSSASIGATRCAVDVLLRVHGDCFGVLIPNGTPLPHHVEKKVEALNRTDSTVNRRSTLALGTTISAALHLCYCDNLLTSSLDQVTTMSHVRIEIPKLMTIVEERFAVRVAVDMYVDGSVTLNAIHPATGTIVSQTLMPNAALVERNA